MPLTTTLVLPESLTTIICDHYEYTQQLKSLGMMMCLNRRVSAYARRGMYRRFDFVDNKSNKILERFNDLVDEYEGGELLDDDILSAIDNKDIDPLELEVGLRWLKGMRTCQVIHINDLLYAREIASLTTLGESLSERNLVLLPNVKHLVLSSKIVKRIHALEHNGYKQTPMDLLIALYHATRPTIICIQDSSVFNPPKPNSLYHRMLVPRQGEVNGRITPSARGHISHVLIQIIKSTAELQEIRYHQVDPYIPIYPKKGVKHVVEFKREGGSSTGSPSTSTSTRRTYTEEIITAIKDIISRSVVDLDPDPEDPVNPGTEGAGSEGAGSEGEAEDEPYTPGETGEQEEGHHPEQEDEDLPGFDWNGEEEEDERRNRSNNGHGNGDQVPPPPYERRQSQWHFILPSSRSPTATSTTTQEGTEIEGLEETIRNWVRQTFGHEDDGRGELMQEILDGLKFERRDAGEKCRCGCGM